MPRRCARPYRPARARRRRRPATEFRARSVPSGTSLLPPISYQRSAVRKETAAGGGYEDLLKPWLRKRRAHTVVRRQPKGDHYATPFGHGTPIVDWRPHNGRNGDHAPVFREWADGPGGRRGPR